MEQKITNIETSVGRIEKDLGEFISFTKIQFEKQEKILEGHSGRLQNIKGTLQGIQQAFLFKAF